MGLLNIVLAIGWIYIYYIDIDSYKVLSNDKLYHIITPIQGNFQNIEVGNTIKLTYIEREEYGTITEKNL